MKIRIEEGRPGELEERVDQVVAVLGQLAGRPAHAHLEKAGPAMPVQTEAKWEYPAIKGSYERRKAEVDRLAKIMEDKLLSVLE